MIQKMGICKWLYKILCYNYGGIYLDTDVLVLDNLEELLENRANLYSKYRKIK